MEQLGLHFLGLLAKQKKSGVYLEVGPLFGSSTNAIGKGRPDSASPIHTIDTFEAAPWVRERFGYDLSRELFERYTAHIPNLHIHQGFAPDVVRDSWNEKIGFYFDDATHGDPGWTANYEFFETFFQPDCLICGDDFAAGWPDIIDNVHKLSDAAGVNLYVMGRVWCYAMQDAERIEAAIDEAAPDLAGARIITVHDGVERSLPAASWSFGLFRRQRLSEFAIDGGDKITGRIEATRRDGKVLKMKYDGSKMKAWDLAEITPYFKEPIGLHLCLAGPKGRSRKIEKTISSRQTYVIPEGHRIVALRLIEMRGKATRHNQEVAAAKASVDA